MEIHIIKEFLQLTTPGLVTFLDTILRGGWLQIKYIYTSTAPISMKQKPLHLGLNDKSKNLQLIKQAINNLIDANVTISVVLAR